MSLFPSIWLWLGVAACIVQSAIFAGLNLAVFSLSPLRLQLNADGGNADAARVLALRKDSNDVLTTVIWGSVSTNVLLTLLSNSVLAGLEAFFFSAVVITLLGEIIPQAYFSRNALWITARFLPFLNFYRVVLFPIAKPTALLLDWWLGKEAIAYLREREVRSLILRSAGSGGDIGRLEAIGARNFLDLDDIAVTEEGLAPADRCSRYADQARRRHRPHESRTATPGRRRDRQRSYFGLGRAEAHHHRRRSVGAPAAGYRDAGRGQVGLGFQVGFGCVRTANRLSDCLGRPSARNFASQPPLKKAPKHSQ
jgi:hypothetical protein